MTVKIDLPPEIEALLRQQTQDVAAAVREAVAVMLFRQGRITHLEFSSMLGIDRLQAEAVLSRHGVLEDTLTAEEIEADRRTLERLLGPAR